MQEMQETKVRSLSREDPLEKGMETHSSIHSWVNPHRQRNLAGYSPRSHKESDMTEATEHANHLQS